MAAKRRFESISHKAGAFIVDFNMILSTLSHR